MSDQFETYKLGDFKLQSGGEIPDAFLAYKTLGEPSNPIVIYLTWYSGSISDTLWLTGPEKTLDPSKYFIVVPALFGGGQSSSPSNMPRLRPFPNISMYDNVRAQHELVTQHLGIKHARAVLGWSMGAGQTYQWGTQFPDFMDILIPFCGAAETSPLNQVFLEGLKSSLYSIFGISSAGICETTNLNLELTSTASTLRQPREMGLKALGRIFAGWGFSPDFYRERLYEKILKFKGLEDFMLNFWEAWALSNDPEDLLVMTHTWQAADCSAQHPYDGDFKAAMQGIKAKTLILPSKTDMCFSSEDSEIELRNMRDGVGELRVFQSIWGHWAGGPGLNAEDAKWLDDQLRDIFASN